MRRVLRDTVEAATWVLPVVAAVILADRVLSAVGCLLVGAFVGYRLRRRLCRRHEAIAEQRGHDRGRRRAFLIERRRRGLPPERDLNPDVPPPIAYRQLRELPRGAATWNDLMSGPPSTGKRRRPGTHPRPRNAT